MSVGQGYIVAIVEDDDEKFRDIFQVISSFNAFSRIERASNLKIAEKMFDAIEPDILILDISMNISNGSLGPLRGGFANLGGLDLLDRLFHLGLTIPTIIVTGFDAFRSGDRRNSEYEIVGLPEIVDLAGERLGANLLGTIRYQSADWDKCLEDAVRGWLHR